MSEAETGFVQVGGRRTGYRLSGEIGAPVIVFSNSLMATMAMWDPVLSRLEGRWRLLRYDTRGHGATAAPNAAFGIADLALDVVALLDALDIDRVHVVGLSLGGMVGLGLAATHGERVLSLTASDCGSSVSPAVRDGWAQRIEGVVQHGVGSIVDGTIARWFRPEFLAGETATIAWVRDMLLQTGAAGYAGCGAAIRDLDLSGSTAAIRAPTLILNGREDTAWPPSTALALQQEIAGARLAFVEHAAHVPCIERPGDYARLLSEFLLGVEARRP